MPALVAGIHVFLSGAAAKKDVDGRDKPGLTWRGDAKRPESAVVHTVDQS
jgi:hypothetical protein